MLHAKILQLSWGKACVRLFELNQPLFSCKIIFTSKNNWHALESAKLLLFQRKQLTVFVANNNIWAFKQNLKFLESLHGPPGFHYLFWWDQKRHKQMWFFKHCIIKCINTGKSYIPLNQYFPNYQCIFHQFNCRTHLEPQSWYKDYFQLKTFKVQQMLKKASSELSLANSSNFWEIRLS